MHVLVTGGAGYIGAHAVDLFNQQGLRVICIDNHSGGRPNQVAAVETIQRDFSDPVLLDQIFQRYPIEAVAHFASHIQVGESHSDPASYYRNNVCNTQLLLDKMVEYQVNKLVFSSSAAVYGAPQATPITEDHSTNPLSPYGRTKLMVEMLLADYQAAYGLNYVAFRYFNAVGASPNKSLGERHVPESHLVPLALQVASGRKSRLRVFGSDYPTADGTCVRDYVHVCDLVEAHWLALNWLVSGESSLTLNLGTGTGHSVREMLQAIERVTGNSIDIEFAPRRAGDPATLVASADRAHAILGWERRYTDLDETITHAWLWEQKLCAELAQVSHA